jgi:hypothetical protein
MRKKMEEIETQQPPTVVAAPSPTVKTTAKEPAKPEIPSTVEKPPATTPTTAKTEPPQTTSPAKPPGGKKKADQRFTTEFPPMPTPPSALSNTKDARLAELLRRYRADEITPEQYHRERAKILAEP